MQNSVATRNDIIDEHLQDFIRNLVYTYLFVLKLFHDTPMQKSKTMLKYFDIMFINSN